MRMLFVGIWNRLKIRPKALILIAIVILLSDSLLFWGMYSVYLRSVKVKAQSYSANMIGQMVKYTDAYFMDIESFASSIAYNTIIQNSLSMIQSPYSYDAVIQKRYIENSLKLIVYSRSDLQIAVFGNQDEHSFYTPYTSINPRYNFKDEAWFQQAEASSARKLFIVGNQQNYYVPEDRKPVYTFLYKISNMFTLDTIGYVLIDIDKQRFNRFFENNYLDIEHTLILDKDNSVIYSDSERNEFQTALTQIPKTQKQGYFTIDEKEQSYMVIYDTSDYFEWKIVNILRMDTLLQDTRDVKVLLLMIACGLFVVAATVLFSLSHAITRPVTRLRQGMELAKSGQMQMVSPVASEDEIGDLIRDFNSMIGQIDHLMRKNKTIELIKKETELQSLQQQINPHFLYNTLENVIGLAGECQYEKIIQICKNLGYMFRYNLNGQNIVSVREEVEQCQSYTGILAERHDGKFKPVYVVDSAAETCSVMKFLLQPFVENANTHGFKHVLSGGLLTLSVGKEAGTVWFEVWDNGCGIPPAILESIQSELVRYSESPIEKIEVPLHLGIVNVYVRLKLLYGDRAQFSLTSEYGQGTSVKIAIPEDRRYALSNGEVDGNIQGDGC